MNIYVISYFLIIVIQLILLKSFSNISRQSFSFNFKHIVVILVFSLIEVFLSFFVFLPINAIICIFYYIFIIKWTTRKNLKEIMFYTFILWIFGVVLDIGIMLFVNVLGNFFPIIIDNIDLVKILASIVLAICLLTLSNNKYLKSWIYDLYKRLTKLNFSSIKIIVVLILYVLLDIICFININNGYTIVILFSSTILITYSILCKYEIDNLKATNDLLIQNNEFYLKVINDYHVFRHNLINQLLGLKTVSNKESKLIIDDLINEYSSSFENGQNIKDLPSGLDGLILEKIYNYNNKINISIDNKLNKNIFKCLKPRNYILLCESLGIVLDNALESAILSDEKILYMRFRENKSEIIITLINSFAGSLDLEVLGKMNYTSKNKGHGYGLFTLFEKKKINIKTSIKNNLFQVEFKIEKKKLFRY